MSFRSEYAAKVRRRVYFQNVIAAIWGVAFVLLLLALFV